jgi:hypothetical protein
LDVLANHELGRELLGLLAERLCFFGRIDAVKADSDLRLVAKDCDGVAVAYAYDLGGVCDRGGSGQVRI